MTEPLRFSGIMPANIMPFKADLSIDETAYRRHLRWLADTRGVTGIVVNGHAAEVASLTREERRRALAVALDEVAGKCPIVAGVYTDGTAEAVELALDAKTGGAAGILLFPPTLFMWGAQQKPDMVLRHYAEGAAGDISIRWRVEGTDGLAMGTIGWPRWPERAPSTLRYTCKAGGERWFEPAWKKAWFPDAFAGTMGDLLRALEEGREPETSGEDNLDTLRLVEACYRGAVERRVVSLDEARHEE